LSLGFSPDGNYLASGASDSTVLVWDVRSYPREYAGDKTKLSSEATRKLWADLFKEESSTAYAAIWKFVAGHDYVVSVMKEKWHGGKPNTHRVLQLIKDLDSNKFQIREQSFQELKGFGREIIPILRDALGTNPSTEARVRLNSVMAELDSVPQPGQLSRSQLQGVRVIQILEYIGTTDAKRLLEEFNRHDPRPDVREQAKGALARLARDPRDDSSARDLELPSN
jgi:hypothetical protein